MAHVNLEAGAIAFAIWLCIEDNNIDLVVAGTGIPNVITGNIDERLLPLIPCSILAVTPKDLVSPVALERSE